MKLVAILRLVSKACRDAVAQYAGRASCCPGHELSIVGQILPGMRELKAVHRGGRLDAQALSHCSQLTRLIFARHPDSGRHPRHLEPIYPLRNQSRALQNMTFDAASGFLRPIYQADLDISHLPCNLRALELDNVLTYPADYSTIQFTGLTELSYFSRVFEDSLLCDLLDCLPHLQVTHFDTPRHSSS